MPGRQSSTLQFRVVSLEGLGDVGRIKNFGPLDVETIVRDFSRPARSTGKIFQGVISPISIDVEDDEIFSNLTRCNGDLKIILVKRILATKTKRKTECVRVNLRRMMEGYQI